MAEPTRCLSVAKVAESLDVSDDAVYDLIREGHLHAVEVGRRRSIPVDEYERFVQAGGTRRAS